MDKESLSVPVVGDAEAVTISLHGSRGGKMQRDMEVVRKVLLALQEKKNTDAEPLVVEGVSDQITNHHVALLTKAGYIDGVVFTSVGDGVDRVLAKDLTWEGHEFLGALITEDSVWQKVKEALGPEKLATMPLKMIQDLATKALTAWAANKMGL